MRWRNDAWHFGVLTRLLHWSAATAALAVLWLGWWMVDLGYYDVWYNRAPRWHEALGLLVLVLGVALLAWSRLLGPRPGPPAPMPRWVRGAAGKVHALLYAALLVLPVTGYLVSTSSGAGIDVLGLFGVPAVGRLDAPLREAAIDAHYYLAYALPGLVLAHAGAALKHHLVDRDDTLRRMLRGR